MNAAYLSALSALAGSAIGATASFGTTWITQRHQDRQQRIAQESARRESLFGEFIDQASKLFTDSLVHSLDDPGTLVPLFAVLGKLRLFASREVIESAEAVARDIIETYRRPNEDLRVSSTADLHRFDPLRQFTEVARRDLSAW